MDLGISYNFLKLNIKNVYAFVCVCMYACVCVCERERERERERENLYTGNRVINLVRFSRGFL